MKVSRGTAIATVVGLAGLGGFGAPAAPPAEAQNLQAPIITPGAQVNKDFTPTRIHMSQTILVDPTDDRRLVIVEGDMASNQASCPVHVSLDRGRTWSTQVGQPKPDGYGTCVRATFGTSLTAAFGADGTLYVLGAAATAAMGGGTTDAYVARSSDLGATWEFTTIARGEDQWEFTRPDGAKATDTGRFNRFSITTHPTDPNRVYAGLLINPGTLTLLTQANLRSLVAVSTDGGRTFGAPVDIFKGTPTTEIFGGDSPALAVAKDGTIYAFTKERPPAPAGATAPTAPPPPPTDPAAPTTTTVPTPPTTAALPGAGCPAAPAPTSSPTPPPTVPAVNTQLGAAGAGDRLLFAKSSDGGATWTGRSIDDTTAVCRFCLTTPVAAINHTTGEVYVVFEHSDSPPPDARSDRNIWFMSSADGGETFTKRARLNDDESARQPGYNQVFPNVSVAPNGRVDVVWFDFRTDALFNNEGVGWSNYAAETCWDVFYTYSVDGGRTWAESNLRVSDRSMNKFEGFSMNPGYGPMGPMGIASTNRAAYVAWPDSRAGRPLVPVQDTYFATVLHAQDIEVASRQINAGSMGIGTGLGLAAAGLVALVMTGRARRASRSAGAG